MISRQYSVWVKLYLDFALLVKGDRTQLMPQPCRMNAFSLPLNRPSVVLLHKWESTLLFGQSTLTSLSSLRCNTMEQNINKAVDEHQAEI